MNALPDPVWPVVVLAVIQAADAAFCVRPLRFVRQCLQDVHFPERYWRLLTPIKLTAATGLLVGLKVDHLALVTTLALIVYFVLAITAHVRARDFGRNLFVNASGMLVLCCATLLVSFA